MSNVVPPSAAEPLGPPPAPDGEPSRLRRLFPPYVPSKYYLWGGLALGFVVVLLLVWYGTSCLVGDGCFQAGGPTPQPTPEGGACLDVNGAPVACTAPTSLEVRGRLISVQAQQTQGGGWPWFPDNPDYASWVQGTVVNYVLGVAASAENSELFDTVNTGDVFTLTLENGSSLIYEFSAYDVVDTAHRDVIFDQKQPSLTLVLLGADVEGKKRILRGAWVATLGTPEASEVYGVPVALDGAQITVLSSQYLRDPALGLPEGSGYFLVDFALAYNGDGALDTQLVDYTLVDAARLEYSPTDSAVGRGHFQPPQGQVVAGEMITATVGYLVTDLPGRSVSWRVRLRPEDTAVATFPLSFANRPAGQEARAQAVVSIASIEVAPDGGSLTVSGVVVNPSGETLVVTLADIALSTGVAQSPVITSEPALPWQVAAGDQVAFRLTFLKPPTRSAVFSLLGRTFAVNNIP